MPRQKEQVTITLPPELLKWLDEMIEKRIFANRSHGIEFCLKEYKERYERGK